MKTSAFLLALTIALSTTDCSSQTERHIEQIADNIEKTMESFGEYVEELGELCDTADNSMQVKYSHRGKGTKKIAISSKDPLVTRKFPTYNYNGIQVGYNFKVIMCDTVDSVTVRVNEKLKNLLNVRYNQGLLIVTLDNIKNLTSTDGAHCGYIYLPYNLKLAEISLSSSALFVTSLPVSAPTFKTKLSGASTVHIPSITANEIELSQSGVSSCKSKLKCNKASIILSGATKLDATISATNISIDQSGTSTQKAEINCANLHIDLSGASKATFSGKATKMNSDLSGSSRLSCPKLNVAEIQGSMSGISTATVHCTSYIEMNLSGTSYLSYSGNPKTKLDVTRTAHAEHN